MASKRNKKNAGRKKAARSNRNVVLPSSDDEDLPPTNVTSKSKMNFFQLNKL